MNTYVLLHFERKNDVTIIMKLHRASCLKIRSIQKFDNDSDAIGIHGINVKYNTCIFREPRNFSNFKNSMKRMGTKFLQDIYLVIRYF